MYKIKSIIFHLKLVPNAIKRLIFWLREKGIKWTYNYLHYRLFYLTPKPLLLKSFPWILSHPPYIEVEVTTRCNLKCIMCEHTYWSEKGRDMSFEDFKKIIDQFPHLKFIGLTGIGESFLHKDFLKMIRYVKSKSIYVELYDSFYFIDEQNANELLNLGIDHLFASVDAATKQTYEKIRVGSNFDKVINNVKTFVRLKKERKLRFPQLDFHYIVSRINIHEISQYIELVYSIDTDSKIVFTRVLHKFPEIEDKVIEVPKEIMEEAEKKAKELKIKIGWGTDVPQIKPPINHCVAWIMPFIFVTGEVIPCCAGNEANRREFQKGYSLGNVFEKSFKEIWNSEKYKRLRRMIHRGRVPIQCRNCSIFNIKGKK